MSSDVQLCRAVPVVDVPPGDPEALRAAARSVRGVAHRLAGVRLRLDGVTSLARDHRWRGAGAGAFLRGSAEFGGELRAGVEGLGRVAGVLGSYADDLAGVQAAALRVRQRALAHNAAVRRRNAQVREPGGLPGDVLDLPFDAVVGPSQDDLERAARHLDSETADVGFEHRQAVRRAVAAFSAVGDDAPAARLLADRCRARPRGQPGQAAEAAGLFFLTGLLAMADAAQFGADPLTDGLTVVTGAAGARALGRGASRELAVEGAARGRPGVPFGFTDATQVATFSRQLHGGLAEAGFPEAEAALQGSSVTGVKFTTGEPFDLNRVSDVDIALAGDRMLDRAKELGVELRAGGKRTAPLDEQRLKQLGLYELAQRLSSLMGRDVHFMLYGRLQTAVERGPSCRSHDDVRPVRHGRRGHRRGGWCRGSHAGRLPRAAPQQLPGRLLQG